MFLLLVVVVIVLFFSFFVVSILLFIAVELRDTVAHVKNNLFKFRIYCLFLVSIFVWSFGFAVSLWIDLSSRYYYFFGLRTFLLAFNFKHFRCSRKHGRERLLYQKKILFHVVCKRMKLVRAISSCEAKYFRRNVIIHIFESIKWFLARKTPDNHLNVLGKNIFNLFQSK